ncbi:MAG: T9SS type A sorting domain-containing protein, partial [Bacteroidota bacterium]|nr:T9SS type A sorting domain-containing protein [Bacteroidota bacterium]
MLDSTILTMAIEPRDVKLDWSVFPNPTQGDVWVSVSDDVGKTGLVRVLNLLGAVILEEQLTITDPMAPVRIDLSSLESGLYHIELSTGASRSVRKVIRW